MPWREKTHHMEEQIEDMWRDGKDAAYAEMGAGGEVAVYDDQEAALLFAGGARLHYGA